MSVYTGKSIYIHERGHIHVYTSVYIYSFIVIDPYLCAKTCQTDQGDWWLTCYL